MTGSESSTCPSTAILLIKCETASKTPWLAHFTTNPSNSSIDVSDKFLEGAEADVHPPSMGKEVRDCI